MKYIRTKTDGFFVFPSRIPHIDFAHRNWVFRDDIIGAGFIRNGQCCDRSVSLGIAAGGLRHRGFAGADGDGGDMTPYYQDDYFVDIFCFYSMVYRKGEIL